MNEFQAAMGIVNLPGLEAEMQKRKVLAETYCEHLRDIPGIRTYPYREGIAYNYAYFPIKVMPEYGRSRDALWQMLKEKGISTRKLYDKLTCDYSCYRDAGYVRKTDYADQVTREALDLPMYGTLETEDIEYICENIKALGE
jgi:dTDP-4-amino-4,6-dideoxygalactose transaminase